LIDPAVAHQHVVDYLAATGATARYPGLRWAVVTGTDRVVVHVAAPLDLPLTLPGLERRTTISATAASYVVVSD
jgi:hypothetical protein